MTIANWLNDKLKEISVAELERKTHQLAEKYNDEQRTRKKDKVEELNSRVLSPADYEIELIKIQKKCADRKRKVSQTTIFRIKNEYSSYSPQHRTLKMLEEVLGKYEAEDSIYDDEDWNYKSDYQGLRLDFKMIARQKQNDSCLCCDTELSKEESIFKEINLAKEKNYSLELNDSMLSKRSAKTTILICKYCLPYFSKTDKLTYKNMIEHLREKLEYSQQNLADELGSCQPVISRMISEKINWIDESIAVKIHKMYVTTSKSVSLANDYDKEGIVYRNSLISIMKDVLLNSFGYPQEAIESNFKLSNIAINEFELKDNKALHCDLMVRDVNGVPTIACYFNQREEKTIHSTLLRKLILKSLLLNVKYFVCLGFEANYFELDSSELFTVKECKALPFYDNENHSFKI